MDPVSDAELILTEHALRAAADRSPAPRCPTWCQLDHASVTTHVDPVGGVVITSHERTLTAPELGHVTVVVEDRWHNHQLTRTPALILAGAVDTISPATARAIATALRHAADLAERPV